MYLGKYSYFRRYMYTCIGRFSHARDCCHCKVGCWLECFEAKSCGVLDPVSFRSAVHRQHNDEVREGGGGYFERRFNPKRTYFPNEAPSAC